MQCQRCDEVFATKQNLLKHLMKKKQCIPLSLDKAISTEDIIKTLKEKQIEGKVYNCKYCSTPFANNSNRHHHQKICKKIPTAVVSAETTKHTQNINNSTIINNPIMHNPTINNINNTNNIHITINALGNEDIGYLTEENVKNLFVNKLDGVIKLIELKHLNKENVENNNLRKSVHKDKFIQYVEGNKKWNTDDKYNVSKVVLNNLGKDLVSFLNANKDVPLNEYSDDQQIILLKSFMDHVGLPLDWFKLYETEFFQQYKPELHIPHPIDFSYGKKVKKNLSDTISEKIYLFTKCNECPF